MQYLLSQTGACRWKSVLQPPRPAEQQCNVCVETLITCSPVPSDQPQSASGEWLLLLQEHPNSGTKDSSLPTCPFNPHPRTSYTGPLECHRAKDFVVMEESPTRRQRPKQHVRKPDSGPGSAMPSWRNNLIFLGPTFFSI